MKVSYRPYQKEEDFWAMRALLREIYVLNGYRERAWAVARLEYARWHGCINCAKVSLEDVAHLWEADGKLIAFGMPDGGPEEVHMNVHPAWKTRNLEEEMLAVAEEKLSVPTEDGRRFLGAWAMEDDTLRQQILTEHGYKHEGWVETQHYRDLSLPIEDMPTPAVFTLRALGDGLELLERCYASGLGFHQGDIKVAVENRDDPTWYRNIQTAPLYRRDLDLVAVAPDGSIASFCTIWFDDVTRSAYFEPVATVPAYQRKGLSRALLTEGLKRLQKMGALQACVGGYEPGPNALYESVMGHGSMEYQSWQKTW
jgi:mycothiol synthase